MNRISARPPAWQSGIRAGSYGAKGEGLRVVLYEGRGVASVLARRHETNRLPAMAKQAYGLEALPGADRWVPGVQASFVGIGPGSWLVLSNMHKHEALARDLRSKLGAGASVADQCDARLLIGVSGPAAREVLAKGIPLDLHPRAFGRGSAATTMIRDIGVHLWQESDEPSFGLTSPRSTADSLWMWLMDAAAPYGCKAVSCTN